MRLASADGGIRVTSPAQLVVMRLPNLFYETPLVLVGWSFGATAVMAAGAWLLHDRIAGIRSVVAERVARILFAVSLVPFGLAHFMYLGATAPLLPAWRVGGRRVVQDSPPPATRE